MKKFISFVDWDTACVATTLGWGVESLSNYLNCETVIYNEIDLGEKRIETDTSNKALVIFNIGSPPHVGLNTKDMRCWFPNAKFIALCAETQYYQFNNLNTQMDPDGIDLHLEITLSGLEWLKSKGANVDWWHWGISEKLINLADTYKRILNKTSSFVEDKKTTDFIGVYHPYTFDVANKEGWRYQAIQYINQNGHTFTNGGYNGPKENAHQDPDLYRLFDNYIASWFTLGTTSHNRPEITRNQSAKFFRDELGPILDSLLIYNDCPLIRKIYGNDLVPFYDYDDNQTTLKVYNDYVKTEKYHELLSHQKDWVKEHSFEKELILKLVEHNFITQEDLKL